LPLCCGCAVGTALFELEASEFREKFVFLKKKRFERELDKPKTGMGKKYSKIYNL